MLIRHFKYIKHICSNSFFSGQIGQTHKNLNWNFSKNPSFVCLTLMRRSMASAASDSETPSKFMKVDERLVWVDLEVWKLIVYKILTILILIYTVYNNSLLIQR